MKKIVNSALCILTLILELNGDVIKNEELISQAKRELGHRLFYDADLSINGTMSCATCHEQKRAFADGNTMHPGALGDPAKRNVPGLANVSLFKNLTWAHNNLSGLAEQSLMPIKGTEPVEMGMNGYEDEVGKRFGQNECYKKLFSIAFPDKNGVINLDTVSLALESFLKTFISENSLYDQKLRDNELLPSTEAREGKELFFGEAKCNTCHTAPLFSDDSFHKIQLNNKSVKNQVADFGLYDVTGDEKDKNVFRTPSLRNASLTSPYWHDGSAKTLLEAIQKHDVESTYMISMEQINKIIAFIETLNDYEFINNPKFSKPSKECPY